MIMKKAQNFQHFKTMKLPPCVSFLTMKKIVRYLLISLLLISCADDIVIKDCPENVFKAFWNSMNEHYVNFDEKRVDWDSVYQTYYPEVQEMKCDTDLIPVFQKIIDSLKDKHISIAINKTNYIQVLETDTSNIMLVNNNNYKFTLIEPYKLSNGFALYQSRLRDYICIDLIEFFSTFNYELLTSEIKKLNYSKGIIIDIRNNHGGFLKFPLEILSWFYKGEKTLFYQSYKLSPAQNDFITPKPFVYSGKGIIPDSIPIVLLTNQRTNSAANFFAYIIHDFPNCISVGLPTGGGDGPVHNELLPNGWILQYPYFRNYSLKGVHFERKLVPDYSIVNTDPMMYDDQYIKALCLLDSINKYPYTDYKKIWD